MARKSLLVDRLGRPVSYSSFYEGGSYATQREYPFYFYNAAQDTEKLVDQYSWTQLLSAGRFLFANVPILRGGVLEQANFSLPLATHYDGADKDWGAIAEDWVYEWQKNLNVRGPHYSSQVQSRLRLIGRKVDGDIYTLLIRSNRGDFPKTQLIRAHRIGDRYGYNGVIKQGPFKGKRSKWGVIHDSYMRPIGYCILGEKESEDQYASANDMFPSFRPDASDIIRAPSELCACIRSFADIKRLREYEMRAQQLTAAVALIEKNETGYADEGSDAFNDGSGTPNTSPNVGITTESYEEGLIKYYKAKSGAGLEAFRSDRPSADAQSWEDKIVGQAFYGIEWDPDFAMCLKQPGGAWVRAKMTKICRAIANNVAVEAWAQRVEISFAVANAIRDGVLPMPKDGDFYSWKCSLGIPLPTADSGNEEAAAREAYKIGWLTLQAVASRNGGWWTDLRKQKQVELRDLIQRAKELQTEFPELALRELMFLLEQREANSKSDPEPAQDDSTPEKEAA